MKSKTILFLCFAILMMACFHSTANAQGKAKEKAENHIAIYKLEHIEVDSLFEVVATMLEGKNVRMQADPRGNSLIVLGDDNAHAEVQKVLKVIDRESTSNSEIRFYVLGYSKCTDVAESLQHLIDSETESEIRISCDPKMNSLIVMAEPNQFKMIDAVVKRLDAPVNQQTDAAPDCTVRITWLAESKGHAPLLVESLAQPASALKSLIDGLKKTEGFEEVKTVTACSTRVGLSDATQKKEFSNSSIRHTDYSEYSMKVSGFVTRKSDDKYDLEISIDLMNDKSTMSVGSTFSIPKNHPLALSISDFGILKSVAVIEVVE